MEFALRSVPDLLRLTSPSGHGKLLLEVTKRAQAAAPPSWPQPGQLHVYRDLIPSAQAHRVPPEALLSCQHFLHSSADIPASRVCVRNAVLQASPAQAPSNTERLPPLSLQAPPPEFPLAFSSYVGARQDLQETGNEGLKGARIKMSQCPASELGSDPS